MDVWVNDRTGEKLYPELPELPELSYCRVPGEKLDCQDLMNGDIIYAL